MARLLPPPAVISQRRVVVTGLGGVTPLANGIQESWERLLEGRCGIKRLRPSASGDSGPKLSERMTAFPTSLAAAIERGSDAGMFPGPSSPASPRGTPDFIQFAVHAAREALVMSAWSARTEAERDRAGVAIGSGIGSLEDVADAYHTLEGRGYRRLTPHFIPRILVNLAAGHVAIEHGLRGPNHATSTACATGAHAIGDAFRFIKHGDADVMVCGGTEGSVHEAALAGFARMNALSTRFNDEPERASRPFDKDRDGFVLAEGAAVLVLEEMEHARHRGANILAEVRGYGLSGDAYHIAAPTEDGDGPGRAMRAAIEESGLPAEAVGYVNAHATSTPLGDAAEGRAIERVFGRRPSLLVSSTKGATGHLLGAAGSLEAAFSILALRDGVVPHTLNLATPEPEMGFTLVKDEPMAVFAEHIILGVKAAVRVLIEEVPDGVEQAMAEELLHNQEESRRRVEGALGFGEDVAATHVTIVRQQRDPNATPSPELQTQAPDLSWHSEQSGSSVHMLSSALPQAKAEERERLLRQKKHQQQQQQQQNQQRQRQGGHHDRPPTLSRGAASTASNGDGGSGTTTAGVSSYDDTSASDSRSLPPAPTATSSRSRRIWSRTSVARVAAAPGGIEDEFDGTEGGGSPGAVSDVGVVARSSSMTGSVNGSAQAAANRSVFSEVGTGPRRRISFGKRSNRF